MEVGIIFVLDVFDYAQVPGEQNGQRTTPNGAEELAGSGFWHTFHMSCYMRP